MNQIRQGDVFLVKIDKLPEGIKQKDNILAYGEVTGHHHRFPDAKQVQVFSDESGNQFVSVNKKSILQHEEHGHLQVPEGNYKIIIQREYDIMEGVRRVLD